MPSKVLLHIGCPKTGTSYIQQFLYHNQRILLDNGYFVPVFLQRDETCAGVHAWVTLLSFSEHRIEPLVVDYGMEDPDVRRYLREQKLNKLSKMLDEYSDYTWIISDEILAARMLDVHDLDSLQSTILNSFREVDILVFLRNQLESAIGQWSTDIINGSTQEELTYPWDLPEDPMRYLNHQRLLSSWCTALPNARFDVRLYNPRKMLADFAQSLGIPLSTSFHYPDLENKSMSLFCLRLLSRYNQRHPFHDGISSPSDFRRYIPIGVMKAFSSHPGYMPSQSMQKAYQEYFSESNEWVRSTYFPNLSTLWKSVKLPTDHEEAQLDYISSKIENSVLDLLDDLTLRFQIPRQD